MSFSKPTAYFLTLSFGNGCPFDGTRFEVKIEHYYVSPVKPEGYAFVSDRSQVIDSWCITDEHGNALAWWPLMNHERIELNAGSQLTIPSQALIVDIELDQRQRARVRQRLHGELLVNLMPTR